jgi:CRISPR/Cas system-associated protein Csm6
MRETGQLSGSPSPIEDLLDQPREASHELSLSLRNLRRTERRLKDIEKTLFPGPDSGSDTRGSPRDHEEYLKELERIRSEIASFKPIEKPGPRDNKSSWRNQRASSHDSDILAGDEYY